MLLAIVTVVCLAASLIYVYLTWHFDFWRKRGVRGPKPAILEGTFPRTRRGECNFVEELHEIYQQFKDEERFVGVFVARSPRLFILDPRLAQQILTTNFSSFHDNESSKWSDPKVEVLRCSSPFVSVGDDWKQKRSDIGGALSISRLKAFYPSMQMAAAKLIRFLDTQSTEVDAKDISSRFTAEVMADFIWGVNAGAFDSKQRSPIQDAAERMIAQALKCVQYFGRTAAWPWIRKLYPKRFFPKSTDKFFTEITASVITHRQGAPNERSDVLSHLLALSEKKQLSLDQMAGRSTTVLIDGFETAAIAICHCLLLLAENKSEQEKLRWEIQMSVEEDGSLAFDRLNMLPYLDQCIQETLRLIPPLPTLFKICTSPTSLENSKKRQVQLRPGDGVYISSYSFHRDGDLFQSPNDFIPERFDPKMVGSDWNRGRGFLPFGDGPRMCLGMKLGLIETKVAVAEVVRRFDISPGSSPRTWDRLAPSSFLLSLNEDIRLNLKRELRNKEHLSGGKWFCVRGWNRDRREIQSKII